MAKIQCASKKDFTQRAKKYAESVTAKKSMCVKKGFYAKAVTKLMQNL